METNTQREALRARPSDAEIPDPVPAEIKGNPRPLTLREEMQRYIRTELSQAAAQSGQPTFEEEDDFSEDDPDIFQTQYNVQELQDEGELPPSLDGSETEGSSDEPPPVVQGDPAGEQALDNKPENSSENPPGDH